MRSKAARVALLVAAVAAVALIVWLLARPRESATAPAAPRVVIIGVDGLDWEIARAAVAEGRMPHLERLVEEGASGPLQSIPPFISPSIWTTIATGKREDKHGIRSFLATRRHGSVTAPTTSNMRKAKALWQIAGDRGLTVGFIGWLVTWPAERVNGYMVSSLFERLVASSAEQGAGDSGAAAGEVDDSGAAYPAALVQSLNDFVVRPQDLPDETVARLLGPTRRADDAETAACEADLRRYLASDLSTLALAKQLMRSAPTDVCGVYFRGLDLSCHTFWRYRSPGEWPDDIPPGQVETFGPVIDRYYSFADSLIGEIAEAAGDAVVLVCSDHGFGGHGDPGGDKPLIGTAMHRDRGVIAVAGPGVRRGAAVADAGVLDVTPTVLAILGLPVGRDMDGRVLVEVLPEDALTERPVAFIQTHESEGTRGDSEPIPSPVDDEIKEMLRSLGYIE